MRTVYDARTEPVSSRLERVRHLIGESIVPVDIRPAIAPAQLRCELRTGSLGVLQIAEARTAPGESCRTSALIRRSDPELLQLAVQLRGHVTVEQNRRAIGLGPDDLMLVDLSRPCRWTYSAQHAISVTFPRAMLPMPDSVTRLTPLRLASDCGASALVASLVRQLPQQLDDWHPTETGPLGTALLDLLGVALIRRAGRKPSLATTATQNVLLRSIYAFIEQNLSEPDLTPNLIAGAHHISLRTLYKLFETQDEGVASWIRRRRLEQCRRELLDPAGWGTPVSALAARWGFARPSHFSRAFRATYGMPPGEYRAVNGTRPT